MSEPINYKTRLWRIMGPGPMQPLGDRLGRQNSVCVVRGEGAGREGAGRGGAGDTQIDLERWQINQSFGQLRSMQTKDNFFKIASKICGQTPILIFLPGSNTATQD